MNGCIASAISLCVLVTGLAVSSREAIGEQSATAQRKYFFSASFSVDGLKNLQKQSATGFKAGVGKFFASVGGRLESWYFDYTQGVAYGFVDYPDEISAASAQASVNAAGFARVIYRPVLSAEDADKALVKSRSTRPPQEQ